MKNSFPCDILIEEITSKDGLAMDNEYVDVTEQEQDIESRANTALIFGIMSIVLVIFTLGIGSFIFSILTFKKVRTLKKEGDGNIDKKLNVAKALAIIGLVLSIIVLIVVVIAVIVALIALALAVIGFLFELLIAAVTAVLSIVLPIIGMAIAEVIGQMIVTLVEGIIEAIFGGMVVAMLFI